MQEQWKVLTVFFFSVSTCYFTISHYFPLGVSLKKHGFLALVFFVYVRATFTFPIVSFVCVRVNTCVWEGILNEGIHMYERVYLIFNEEMHVHVYTLLCGGQKTISHIILHVSTTTLETVSLISLDLTK